MPEGAFAQPPDAARQTLWSTTSRHEIYGGKADRHSQSSKVRQEGRFGSDVGYAARTVMGKSKYISLPSRRGDKIDVV
jgi:hypothetical protein